MVKFNLGDKFLGEKPKSFKKEIDKNIKKNTLYYMQDFGRAKWVKTEELFLGTVEKADFFDKAKRWFAFEGAKSKIAGATHKLRRDGYPIISGRGRKGYRYADEECEDFIDRWDEVFSAWDERKTNLEDEYRNYEKILEGIIKRLIAKNRIKEAEKLQEVLVKHRQ